MMKSYKNPILNQTILKSPPPVSGSTIQKRIRSRSFQLTCNNLESYEASINELKRSKTLDYIIACRELAPTTGHVHYHIYAHHYEARQLNISKLNGAHVEICRGNVQQNINYIKKDGEIILEEGIVPISNVLTIKELKGINHEDDLPDWKQYNLWRTLKNQESIDINNWHKEIQVYYISGASGVGKSLRAKEIVLENKDKYGTEVSIAKFSNGYWNNVNSSVKIMIYDDFRDSHLPASEFINLIDYNRHTMNIKGGSIINNYELIIITSVIPIDCIYLNMNEEPRQQWLRRIKIIEL